jgi:UDP-glucose 4-epimerase
MERCVLVTGSSGFIGQAVVRLLAVSGYEVRLFDLVTGQDVLSVTQLRTALRNVHAVVHLGAPSSMVHFAAEPGASRRTTIDGTANVLSLFQGRVVVPSTAGVYAHTGVPAREDSSPLEPVNAYAEAKLAAEELCANANAKGGDAKVLRIFTGYGPEEWRKGRAASPVMHIVTSLLAGETPEIFGDGRQKRDCIYIDDIAEAVLLTLESDTHETTFNIGTGCSVDLLEVADEANRQLGTRIRPTMVPARFPTPALLAADTSKAASILGFRARTDLASGLGKTIRAYETARLAHAEHA